MSKHQIHDQEILKLAKEDPFISKTEIARRILGNMAKFNEVEAFRKYVSKILQREIPTEAKHQARILIFDIETAPMRSYTWSMWKQNVGGNQVMSDWFVLCWSAKWLFEEEVLSGTLNPDEVKAEDDSRIMGSLWTLFDEADILIAHNGDRFDIPKANTRFLLHGLRPPSPYQSIDTLKVLKRMFKFSSNRLDYVNKEMGLTRKIDTGGFELWSRCMNGEQEALNEMSSYCDQDVRILEEHYLKVRPWIKSHPNLGMWIEENVQSCPNCGGQEIAFSGKTYTTTVSQFDVFTCDDCGAHGRSRISNFTRGSRSSLLVSPSR